jgi:hypothetical protein
MEVTEADVARIPATNIRVSRAEFGTVWGLAERICYEHGQRDVPDWYEAGVAVTCQWLATAVVRSSTGRRYPARSPITRRAERAYEELIEAEYLAAEKRAARGPRPDQPDDRPGWTEGARATLRWAWLHSGPPPLPGSTVHGRSISSSAAGSRPAASA